MNQLWECREQTRPISRVAFLPHLNHTNDGWSIPFQMRAGRMQYVVASKVVSVLAEEAAAGVVTEKADAAWLPI